MEHPSVSWHIIPLEFSNWNIICFGKRAQQCTIFQTSWCSNESSPNSSCHFWKHKVKVYPNFASLFIVIKGNSAVFFFPKPHTLWTKIAHQSEIFGLLSGWVRIHQIPRVIIETTSKFFFKLCIALQCHESSIRF